jgi:hypothetical protein
MLQFDALLPDENNNGFIMNTAVWQFAKYQGRKSKDFNIIQYMKDHKEWQKQMPVTEVLSFHQ